MTKNNHQKIRQALKKLGTIVLGFLLSFQGYAVSPGSPVVPGSAQTGVISKGLQTAPRKGLQPGQPSLITAPSAAEALGPEAAKIKFKLKEIILTGNHIYTTEELLPIYKDKLNTDITIAQLLGIVNDITNFYRNNGYILSQATLPPQNIKNGIVHVTIYEGYIDKVIVEGNPGKARDLVQAYGAKIAKSRPLNIAPLERYLMLANEIPGMTVKSVLTPSKTNFEASTLDLMAQRQLISGYLSYDNYQSRYVGPNEVSGGLQLNSMIRGGDNTSLGYVSTTRPKQLHFVSAQHSTPLGTEGMTLTGGGYYSYSRPGLNLASLKINSEANYYYGYLKYPIILSLEKSLTFQAGFDYYDTWETSITGPLYADHLRSFKIDLFYTFTDKLHGANYATAELKQGLCVIGATCNARSLTTSRYGGQGGFNKVTGQISRLQPLYSIFSAYLMAQGQYAFVPVLTFEQYAFGGSQIGRGYSPGEIIGDRGLAGSGELRMDTATHWQYLPTLQTYLFYDIGKIWNLRNIAGTPQAISAASTGIGLRFTISKNFNANLTLAQPVTKSIAADLVSGSNGGHKPVGLFSLTATL